MSTIEVALDHLARWTISTERLPPGATLLEPVDSSSAWSAIRNPHTGVVFGWHADARRVRRLFWQAMSEDDRLDLVAEAVAKIKDDQHLLRWKTAWSHWTKDAGARHRAARRAVSAWLRRDRAAVEAALAELSRALYPDEAEDAPEAPPAAAGDHQAVHLRLASAALVQGEVDLGRLIYFYAQVAEQDPGQLPAVLAAAAAAVDLREDSGKLLGETAPVS